MQEIMEVSTFTNTRYYKIFFLFFFLIILGNLSAQSLVADKIVAVVGKSSILYSDIEDQYMQYKAQGMEIDRCKIFEDLLAQKLLVTQAEVDSLEVKDEEVEQELQQRLNYFISQVGTEDKLVQYFGKSILEIKEDMRDAVRDQLLMQKMQAEIVKGISITPSEVKQYYNNLDKDSIPEIQSEVEVNQICSYPKISDQAIFDVKEKLLNMRERVLNGENFSTLAILYSEDPSSSKGGDIGWVSKTDVDPAYAKAALSLKPGQVSKIVESAFGYHLIYLVEKTDDRFHTKHILLTPKISTDAKSAVISRLDSIKRVVQLDSLTFEKAAMYYSEDKESRLGGGLRVNPATLNSKFHIDDFTTNEYYVIRNLKVGEISEPFESRDDKNKTVYKIVQLKSRTEPHKANLKQDFDLLKNMALQQKKTEVVNDWVTNKAKDTYIRLESPYDNCNFTNKAWKK
jgi:peptidyl-prolyl cis-trans isomerase SurA